MQNKTDTTPLTAKDVNKLLAKAKTGKDRMKVLEDLVYKIRQSGYDAGFNSGVAVGRGGQLP